MGFISDLRTKWKGLSKGEKAKIIIEGICDIGSCFIAQTMTRNFYKANDCNLIKRLTIGTTATGLSMWVSNAAANQFGKIIDTVYKTPEEDDDDE